MRIFRGLNSSNYSAFSNKSQEEEKLELLKKKVAALELKIRALENSDDTSPKMKQRIQGYKEERLTQVMLLEQSAVALLK